MTRPDEGDGEAHRAENDSVPPLRTRILIDAEGGNCLPMAHVATVTALEDRSVPDEPRREWVLRTIRSLLDDGLIEVGAIVGGSDERIDSWGLSPAETVERIRALYVDHHDERYSWDFTIWLGLTTAGEQVVCELKDQSAK